MSTSKSLTIFNPQTVRASTVFNKYPWMTNIITQPGPLEDNVATWLGNHPNVREEQVSLCKV